MSSRPETRRAAHPGPANDRRFRFGAVLAAAHVFFLGLLLSAAGGPGGFVPEPSEAEHAPKIGEALSPGASRSDRAVALETGGADHSVRAAASSRPNRRRLGDRPHEPLVRSRSPRGPPVV